MKKGFLFLAGLTAVALTVHAAETPTPAPAKRTALVFSMSGLGNFGIGGVPFGVNVPLGSSPEAPFEEAPLAGLGIKSFLGERLAVRGFFQFGWSSLDEGRTQTYLIGLAPGLEYHWVKTKFVHAYVGGAAPIAIYRSTQKTQGEPGGSGSTRKYAGNVYGLAALLGVEYFPVPNVSFGAEYQLLAAATSGKTESGTTVTDLPKELSVGLGTVAVMLAVYW
jgi:hypothetical protein